jgi:hypothetical protein
MRAHFCHVRIWHQTGMPKYLGNVNSGKHMLALSFSGFDPTRTLALAGQRPTMLL